MQFYSGAPSGDLTRVPITQIQHCIQPYCLAWEWPLKQSQFHLWWVPRIACLKNGVSTCVPKIIDNRNNRRRRRQRRQAYEKFTTNKKDPWNKLIFASMSWLPTHAHASSYSWHYVPTGTEPASQLHSCWLRRASLCQLTILNGYIVWQARTCSLPWEVETISNPKRSSIGGFEPTTHSLLNIHRYD